MTSGDLSGLGISADLAVHYARSGWLHRLARGVYRRPGDTLALHPSLRLLQGKIEGLHVGGKSALEWYGLRQYVSQKNTLHLYGWAVAQLPAWFVQQFPSEYHAVRLCLQLGRELSLPWASKLNAKTLPTGSNRPWVSQSRHGLLVLKP